MEREEQLETIATEIQGWVDWTTRDHESEGLETTTNTRIVSMPYWPSISMLEKWIEVLRNHPLNLEDRVMDKQKQRIKIAEAFLKTKGLWEE